MSDDFDLKIFETKAELVEIKEEIKEIRNQSNALKSEIAFKSLIETVNEVQSKVNVLSINFEEIQKAFAALSNRVSNYDDKFSEMSENLRKLNEAFNKDDTILSQHNEISAQQSKITKILDTNENNLGNQSFIFPIHFQEEQTILLLGGKDGEKELDSLLILENNRQNWKELNIKPPCAVWGHGAQFLNNNLYIFGGGTQWESFNSTNKLSTSLQWEKMADMNKKRHSISNSSVILNNQIWVCGGESDYETLKCVEMYDPETNTWKYMREMNECRAYAAAAVVNGKIFCSGGWDGKSLDSVECYDPSSDAWTLICNMPAWIFGHGAVEIEENLIVMGGFILQGQVFNNVWALDSTDENAKWIDKSSMSISRYLFSIAKIDDKVFLCGGYTREDDERKSLYSVEIFDGEVWRNGPNMPTGRYKAPAVVVPMSFARSLN